MSRLTTSLLALAACLAPAAALAEPAPPPADDGLPGKILLESRLRHESVEQDGYGLDAEALTVRTRFGWESPEVSGLQVLVEVENVAAVIDDYSSPLHPDPLRPAIADEEITELNRAQVALTGLKDTEVVLGRQRIVLGNGRFLGNSAWRQNEQTFDGVRAVSTALKPVTLTYAWIGRVNRPLGRDHPQGVWKGDVHVGQAESDTPIGQASLYGLLIDLDNAPAQSSATVGARLAGARAFGDSLSLTWELEYARQSDYGDNPGAFDLDYRLASAGMKGGRWSAALVYERLEGDGTYGFQTPLASGHGVQGWSDVIGATPAFGVQDVFVRGQVQLDAPGLEKPVTLKAEAHDFHDSDGEVRLGRELDAAVVVPFQKRWSVELKGARFESEHPMYRDTVKGWVSVEFRY